MISVWLALVITVPLMIGLASLSFYYGIKLGRARQKNEMEWVDFEAENEIINPF